ncbi:MAG: AtpZ/AtpI family protein [Spirochaetia bacterium]|jgi:ATP synthase protein I|nr:AtpZ/AtpI family protein [Spirochaetia bacterium]
MKKPEPDPDMNKPDDKKGERGKSFSNDISAAENRRLAERRNKNKQLWFGLGMMGIIGWSVAVPTIAGLAIGIWMDGFMSTKISWTLTGLAGGVAAGCMSAWYWIVNEQKNSEDDNDSE